MTQRTNARLAGSCFLLYIATGVASLVVFGRATRGGDAAAQLLSIVQHETEVRLAVLLTLLSFFWAVALGVTLYALTRDEDRDLATIAMACRVGEGVLGAAGAARLLGLVPIAHAAADTAHRADAAAARAFGALLFAQGGVGVPVTATCFAVGSAIFAWLFLRARTIPVSLAWLGVIASILLVAALPLQIAGIVGPAIANVVWALMALFEVTLALWLIFKGVNPPLHAEGVRSRAVRT